MFTNDENFGKQLDIRENLWRARLRQIDAARLLDIKKQQLNDWCTGKCYPRKHWERHLKKFFMDYGVKLAYKERTI